MQDVVNQSPGPESMQTIKVVENQGFVPMAETMQYSYLHMLNCDEDFSVEEQMPQLQRSNAALRERLYQAEETIKKLEQKIGKVKNICGYFYCHMLKKNRVGSPVGSKRFFEI